MVKNCQVIKSSAEDGRVVWRKKKILIEGFKSHCQDVKAGEQTGLRVQLRLVVNATTNTQIDSTKKFIWLSLLRRQCHNVGLCACASDTVSELSRRRSAGSLNHYRSQLRFKAKASNLTLAFPIPCASEDCCLAVGSSLAKC